MCEAARSIVSVCCVLGTLNAEEESAYTVGLEDARYLLTIYISPRIYRTCREEFPLRDLSVTDSVGLFDLGGDVPNDVN